MPTRIGLVVPARAILKRNNKAYVFCAVDGKVVEKEIRFGLRGEKETEVLSGLTGVPCLGELPFSEAAAPRNHLPVDLFEKEFDLRIIEPVLSTK